MTEESERRRLIKIFNGRTGEFEKVASPVFDPTDPQQFSSAYEVAFNQVLDLNAAQNDDSYLLEIENHVRDILALVTSENNEAQIERCTAIVREIGIVREMGAVHDGYQRKMRVIELTYSELLKEGQRPYLKLGQNTKPALDKGRAKGLSARKASGQATHERVMTLHCQLQKSVPPRNLAAAISTELGLNVDSVRRIIRKESAKHPK